MVSPKVLIISRTDYLRDKESEANTIRSFMTAFPRECVYSILCGDFNIDCCGIINKQTYQLGHKDIKGARFFMGRKRKSNSTIVFSPTPDKGRLNIMNWLKSLAVNLYSLFPYRINESLKAFINECHPDIVYSTFTNYREFILAKTISQKWGVPLVPHFFDDWPNVYYKDTTFSSLFKNHFLYEFKTVLKNVPICFCISEMMCAEYKKRYGVKNAIQLLNSVNGYFFPRKNNKPQVLLYVGSLYLDRGNTIKLLCDTLSELHSGIRLCICAPERHWRDYEPILDVYPFVEYLGFFTSVNLSKVIEKSDALLFVESFRDSLLDYTRLSLSTRVPEYLSTGRPILAIGHQKQGTITYLKNHNVAYVVDNLNTMQDVVHRLIEAEDVDSILDNARKLFKTKHEKCGQQALFKDIINGLVNS